eukprot:5228818-Ditylum_brightwellii.AAC.1
MQANAAFTDCDARACYERIIAIITGLAQYKAGMPLLHMGPRQKPTAIHQPHQYMDQVKAQHRRQQNGP